MHQDTVEPHLDDQGGGVDLVAAALNGESEARRSINALADPIISYQTDRFCKRFCHDNRYRLRCTLARPWGSPPADAPLCEWGNASYAWMLDDLTGDKRLAKFEGRDGSGLGNYLFKIANSLPFYERWKNWRFGRRVHVPTYVADMAPLAGRVFLALRNGDNVQLIAQQLGCAESDIDALAHLIIIELTRRNRLHLLNPVRFESLTQPIVDDSDGEEGFSQRDLAIFDLPAEDQEQRRHLRDAWQELSAVERFVLDAMLIEERDADDVLGALTDLELTLDDSTPAAELDRQQLYYFRRKTLARLASLMEQRTTGNVSTSDESGVSSSKTSAATGEHIE